MFASKPIKHFLYLFLFFPLVCCANSPVVWRGYAMAENISNMHGGAQPGTIFTESFRLTAFYNTQQAGWWQGGQFAFGLLGIGQTHKQSLYTGALQPPSGFSGVPEIRITDLAYQQRFNKQFMLRAGIMDFDDYFNLIEVALPLANSGLTNTATINYNVQLATYPFPGFGAFAKIGDEKLFLLAGIFQGNPQHQSTVFQRGQLVILEGDAYIDTSQAEYKFKAALWDYQQPLKYIATTTKGIYGIAEATWNAWQRKLQAGVTFGINPKKPEVLYESLAGCLVINGFIKQRPNDSLNFAMGRVWLYGAEHPETYYEIGYTIRLLKDLTLTPDIQFFTHPGTIYENAWVGMLRLVYTLPDDWHMKTPGP